MGVMKRHTAKLFILMVLFIILTVALPVTGCANSDFDARVDETIAEYRLSIADWEIDSFASVLKNLFHIRASNDSGVQGVKEYFANVARINQLENTAEALRRGIETGDINAVEDEISQLQTRNSALNNTVEKTLNTQIEEVLSEQGIYNPFVSLKFRFPALWFKLEDSPHLLVISPRDKIESIRENTLVPEMDEAAMADIETKIEALDVSALVVEIGGFAAYPSYVSNDGALKYTINAITEEWIHQYLAFEPLGFRYLLHVTGILRDYDVVTMNETVAGIVSKEIGNIVYQTYYQDEPEETMPTDTEFDFNKEMREIRRSVDIYLAQGEVAQAERFMEQQRQYLAANGYYIRKLNQAYFAYHGTYADSPTSISPIGTNFRELRDLSTSLKDFLNKAASMTNPEELAMSLNQ
jgi:hypothetical protein